MRNKGSVFCNVSFITGKDPPHIRVASIKKKYAWIFSGKKLLRMLNLTFLDYAIIFSYFAVVLATGFFLRRKASTNTYSFFVANREFGWFWIGTSMVATTFSADTPLAVSGITANQGISGNWFWWSWVMTYMAIAVFFSKFWWRSKILTDVELTEIRYSGRSATLLRILKAFYFSILLNGVILGWIFTSLPKILFPFINREKLNPDAWYLQIIPEFLIIGDRAETFLLVILILIIILYAGSGGIRSGIRNDMLQFLIAMGGSLYFAYMMLDYAGGAVSLKEKIKNLYPQDYGRILSFFPSFDTLSMIEMFAVYFGIQWWVQYFSDGTGYLVQRMNTAKSEKDAQLSALWFTFANFVLRTWPWVIIGLAGLVLYPAGENCHPRPVCDDREKVYTHMMFEFSSSGIRGFLLLGLIAAFMSTAETHLQWGASYFTNDFYKRFFRKQASEKELVLVGKLGIVITAIIGMIFASHMETISGAWKFLIAIAAGIGLPQILRWIWWRVNAWTEIVGILSSFFLAIAVYTFTDWKDTHRLILIASGSVFISLVVTWLTEPVDKEVLERFVKRVQPYGFWKPVMKKNHIKPLLKDIALWILGNLSVLFFMLAVGHFLFSEYISFFLYLVASVISGIPVIFALVFQRNS